MSEPRKTVLTTAELAFTYEKALAQKSLNPGPFEEIFFAHRGRSANKWVHYLPFYDRAFAPYRGRAIKMLEIGVLWGGSLQLWRKYFGPEATLFGVDIDSNCEGRAEPPTQIRIGSQADDAFLRKVVAEMGGIDIVLDDGSHLGSHQKATFQTLWPLLNVGGVYVIEDLHTSYWSPWEGGLRRPGTAIELIKQMIDDMHGQYHLQPEDLARFGELGSILVGDSIVAIEKTNRPPTGHFWVGETEPR